MTMEILLLVTIFSFTASSPLSVLKPKPYSLMIYLFFVHCMFYFDCFFYSNYFRLCFVLQVRFLLKIINNKYSLGYVGFFNNGDQHICSVTEFLPRIFPRFILQFFAQR